MSDRITHTEFLVKIDSSSIKTFVAALHLLQKVGRDLIIEVEASLMTLRSLNDNKSSFAAIEFQDSFFDNYDLHNLSAFSCKLAVKPVCMILKNLKNVDHIIMAGVRCQAECNLTFQLHLQNGVIRSYFFCYEDCEILNAVCDESICSFIQTKPRVMAQLLEYIHRSPEIIMVAKPDEFSVRSYHQINEFYSQTLHKLQPSADIKRNNVISTGLSMNVTEFDIYDYRSAAESEALIFCVKELVSFVGFCEVLDLQVFNIYFSTGGSAMKFGVSLDCFAVTVIMATLSHGSNQGTNRSQEENPDNQESDLERNSAERKFSKAKRQREPPKNRVNSGNSKNMKQSGKSKISATTVKQKEDHEEDVEFEDNDNFGKQRNDISSSHVPSSSRSIANGSKRNALHHNEDEEEEAEFDAATITTSSERLFGKHKSLPSVQGKVATLSNDSDDDATIAEEAYFEEERDQMHSNNSSSFSAGAKRQRLSQHPSHRQFYQDGHNTDDLETEDEEEINFPNKLQRPMGGVVERNHGGIEEDDDDEDEIVVKKSKRNNRTIPKSLQSTAGSDEVLFAAFDQLQKTRPSSSSPQLKPKKTGAKRFLDIDSDDSD